MTRAVRDLGRTDPTPLTDPNRLGSVAALRRWVGQWE